MNYGGFMLQPAIVVPKHLLNIQFEPLRKEEREQQIIPGPKVHPLPSVGVYALRTPFSLAKEKPYAHVYAFSELIQGYHFILSNFSVDNKNTIYMDNYTISFTDLSVNAPTEKYRLGFILQVGNESSGDVQFLTGLSPTEFSVTANWPEIFTGYWVRIVLKNL